MEQGERPHNSDDESISTQADKLLEALEQQPPQHDRPDTWPDTDKTHAVAARANEHLGPEDSQAVMDFEIGMAAVKHDVSEMSDVEEHRRRRAAGEILPEAHEERRVLENAAYTDALTGLGNRAAYNEAEARLLSDSEMRVGVFDANRFKSVNDGINHVAGDAALREIGRAVHSAAKEKGHERYVFRFGGDEFVIFAPADEIDSIIDDACARFDQRLADDAPFTIITGSGDEAVEHSFETSRLRDLGISLSGTSGRTFVEADDRLKSTKDERKSR